MDDYKEAMGYFIIIIIIIIILESAVQGRERVRTLYPTSSSLAQENRVLIQ